MQYLAVVPTIVGCIPDEDSTDSFSRSIQVLRVVYVFVGKYLSNCSGRATYGNRNLLDTKNKPYGGG